jgi:ribosome-associated heat shock protein Hsp15
MQEQRSGESAGANAAAGAAASMRIDRWLFAVRLFKSRSLAATAVSGGRVHVNGERVKPSRSVRAGERVGLMRGAVEFDCEVLGLPVRRGPAKEAAGFYRESEASVRRRAEFAERMRLATALAPRPESRPDKHERRLLRRVRGRD